MKILTDFSVDLNARDNDGNTVLHYAAKRTGTTGKPIRFTRGKNLEGLKEELNFLLKLAC